MNNKLIDLGIKNFEMSRAAGGGLPFTLEDNFEARKSYGYKFFINIRPTKYRGDDAQMYFDEGCTLKLIMSRPVGERNG